MVARRPIVIVGGPMKELPTGDTLPPGLLALDDLSDVAAAAPSDGQVLTYDTGTSPPGWRPETPSGGSVFSGAMVRKASDHTAANYSAGVLVTWDQEVYDTDSYHDNVTNNTRLTCPSDGYYQLGGTINCGSVTSGAEYQAVLLKNGSVTFDGSARQSAEMPSATLAATVNLSSGPISCVAGDYFELRFQLTTDTSIDVVTTSNFWIRRVP